MNLTTYLLFVYSDNFSSIMLTFCVSLDNMKKNDETENDPSNTENDPSDTENDPSDTDHMNSHIHRREVGKLNFQSHF